MGKSALCLAAAYRMVERRRFPGGVLHVGLADATSPAAFVHAVLKGVEDAELPYRQARRDVRYDGTCATHATHVDDTHVTCLTHAAYVTYRQMTFELRVADAISALVDGLQGEGTLLILDDVEPLLRTCGGRQAVRDVVVGALKKLPNLRVVISCQHQLPIAHCAQSEIQLSPLNPTYAATHVSYVSHVTPQSEMQLSPLNPTYAATYVSYVAHVTHVRHVADVCMRHTRHMCYATHVRHPPLA